MTSSAAYISHFLWHVYKVHLKLQFFHNTSAMQSIVQLHSFLHSSLLHLEVSAFQDGNLWTQSFLFLW